MPWTFQVRTPGAGGAWTDVTLFDSLKFRQEINALGWLTANILNPSASLKALLVKNNEVRVLDPAPAERWRGVIRDANDDPIEGDYDIRALEVEVREYDQIWVGRREWGALPANVIADEVAHAPGLEPRQDMLLYLDMETYLTDGRLDDLSGGKRYGTVAGGPTTVNGKWGFALQGDGVDAEVNVDPADGDALHLLGALSGAGANYTLSLWVKRAGADLDGILTRKGDTGTVRPWQVLLNTTSGFIAFSISDGTNTSVVTSTTNLLDSAWHHVVAVRDQANDRLQLYVDGVQEGGDVPDATTATCANTDAARVFRNAATGAFSDHAVQHLRVYNRVISVAEIKALAGRAILPGHNGTIDSLNAIGFRSEEERRLVVIDQLCRTVAAEHFVDQDGSDRDRFNIVARRGSVSATATIQFNVNTVLADRVKSGEALYNDIVVLGFGDGINQLRSRTFHASTTRNTLASKVSATQLTLPLVSAASFPAGGGKVQVGMERCRYTSKTGNTLNLSVASDRAYTADGFSSLAAYEHQAGQEVWLHADVTTYYTPEKAAAKEAGQDTASSIYVNGLRQAKWPDPALIDQGAADRLAQRLLAKYSNEREILVCLHTNDNFAGRIGDNINVQDRLGAAYGNSPYRVMAYEFTWDDDSGEHYREWRLELANYWDTLDRALAELAERMRMEGTYGQGATNIYIIPGVQNVKGGVKTMVMDVSIPTEAKAVNKVKIVRLRLMSFENYTSGVATTTSAPAHSHTVTATSPTTSQSELPAQFITSHTATHTIAANTTLAESLFGANSVAGEKYYIEWSVTLSGGDATQQAFMQHQGLTEGDAYIMRDWGTQAGLRLVRGAFFWIPEVTGATLGVTIRNDDGVGQDYSHEVRMTRIGRHTHSVTVTGQTTDAPTHSHTLTNNPDITLTTYTAPSVQIWIDGSDRTSECIPAGPFTVDISDIELPLKYFTVGTHSVEFREAATDKLGRIQAAILVQVFIKSK